MKYLTRNTVYHLVKPLKVPGAITLYLSLYLSIYLSISISLFEHPNVYETML